MGLINDNNLDYLSSDNYSEGGFYLLSKILKKVYQGYLYVALPNTLLAEVVNNWLMNIFLNVQKTKSYIRDTQNLSLK